jgi:hypothetical protein
MKKILLTESEKKAIISEREKAIISNFAKTFNSIKRIDENELTEERPISARYGADPTPEQSAGIDKFVKDFLDKKDKEKKGEIKPNDTKISENDGEDYERQSREVEYGINPNQEQPDMDSMKLDAMKEHLEWLESMMLVYDRAMMYDKKDEVEQQFYKLSNEISNLEQGNQLPF